MAGWRVRVDTGGTFTDAVGIGPDGSIRVAKVLSTSALRGRAHATDRARRFRIDASFEGAPDFCRGFPFRWLDLEPGHASSGTRVAAWDPATRMLEVDRDGRSDPGAAESEGARFEIVSPDEAPVLAARLLTGVPAGAAPPVDELRIATTIGTNALLERRGAPVALFVTRGFADLLRIGDQTRASLFTLDAARPEPLHSDVVEVHERLAADGSIVAALDEARLSSDARDVLERGIRVAAVALMNAWRDPVHERAVGARLRALGFDHVSLSTDVAPTIRLLPRAETATVDATLAPVVERYLDRVESGAATSRLRVLTSAGGLAERTEFHPKDSLLSGPAGGVVGAVRAGRRCGHRHVLTFDMGGTSTDVARAAGEPDRVREHRVGHAHLVAPAVAVETVAAGGGSVCWTDGRRLKVGPHSAGARPGPACYGDGGPLTLTDVNFLLGRLDADRFGLPVDVGAARRAFDAIVAELGPSARATDPDRLLEGFLDIANERMADAVREVSLRRGFDPGEHALVAFGGAGPQFACGVASRLGIRDLVVPVDVGVLSAHGLDASSIERIVSIPVLEPLDEALDSVGERLGRIEARAIEQLEKDGVAPEAETSSERRAVLRFFGQDEGIELPAERPGELRQAFETRYRALYGHRPGRRPIELVSLHCRVLARAPDDDDEGLGDDPPEPLRHPAPRSTVDSVFDGSRLPTAVFDREALDSGDVVDGPALVAEAHSTTVVEPGFRLTVDRRGSLRMRRADGRPGAPALSGVHRPEAVRLELWGHRFTSIAREMGERLRRTSVSTNVKERLDYSCALLTPSGGLLVNAPHIPVHLGALGECVREATRHVELRAGESLVTNHPAFGGSHLPDVTVITPVDTEDGRRIGWVASRAHHAELGGSRPGSMPPDATRLEDEGVAIPPMRLVERGRFRESAIRGVLSGAKHPTRAIDDNIADLEAAVAANHAGADGLRAFASAVGPDGLRAAMLALEELAANHAERALRALGPVDRTVVETLDDGTRIRLALKVADGRATVDFDGTSGEHPGNLNATPAIVRSVVLFFLRVLVDRPIPLNEGLLAPVELRIPPGLLSPRFELDPRRCPAVVGGNVETSQRLLDALVKAAGLAAQSQGTMNNVLFGSARFGFYETLGGGAGAGPFGPGGSAVHVGMTNTRITDAELVEHRYPVRVERFAIRRGSGGAGRHRGGDGIVRELRFLEPVELSVLTQRRTSGPEGAEGGGAGAPGRQRLVRADGTEVELGSVDGRACSVDDRLIVETPGGGGFGPEP